jgi:glutathione synthase/RimK-type ligase-like ATP-grasp enzyme
VVNSVAIATCSALPDGDEDAPLLRAALERRGVDVSWQVWDDPLAVWSGFDLVVIRSTWDYTGQLEPFLAWAQSVQRLHNPAAVLAWNTDKIYLKELAAAGIPVVPTSWPESTEQFEFPPGEFVVKPSVGAGSKGAGRFDSERPGSSTAARAHVRALQQAGRTVMVQPYLVEVDTAGETALVYLGGQYSHAAGKSAMLAPGAVNELDPGHSRSLFVAERITARTARAEELEVGQQVVDFLTARFGPLLYVRVDLLPTSAGPVIIEVEAAEPSLFLTQQPTGADRLAAAIAELLPADR